MVAGLQRREAGKVSAKRKRPEEEGWHIGMKKNKGDPVDFQEASFPNSTALGRTPTY